MSENSLVVQWLGIQTSTTEGWVRSLVRKLRRHVPCRYACQHFTVCVANKLKKKQDAYKTIYEIFWEIFCRVNFIIFNKQQMFHISINLSDLRTDVYISLSTLIFSARRRDVHLSKEQESRLPSHWLKSKGAHTTMADALWRLRDLMLRDTLNIRQAYNLENL